MTEQQSRSLLAPLIPVLILLAAMWVLEVADAVLPAELDYLGIESREFSSLPDILLAPFLHAGFSHLIANTVPFLVLGSIVALRNPRHFWAIVILVTVLGGLGVWLFGPANAVTLGASGVVFGFLGYLLAAGIFTRHWVDVVIAGAVLLVYGSLLLGALPFTVPEGVSWLAHLTGFLAGIIAASTFARRARPSPSPAVTA